MMLTRPGVRPGLLATTICVALLGCGSSAGASAPNGASAEATAAPTPARMAGFVDAGSSCQFLANEGCAGGGVMAVTLESQTSSYCNGRWCTVPFTDGSGTGVTVFVRVGSGSNTMNELSAGFAQEDVVIRGDDGVRLQVGEAVDLVFGTEYDPKYEEPCDYYARKLVR